MLADKGYDADALRRSLRQAGAVPALPGRVTRRRRTGYDKAALVYRSGQPDEGRRGSLPACCCGLIRASEKALKAAQLGSTARPTPRFSSTGARCSHPFAYERRINLSVQSATLLGESPAPAFDQLATLLSSTDLPATGRPSGPDSGEPRRRLTASALLTPLLACRRLAGRRRAATYVEETEVMVGGEGFEPPTLSV